MDQTILLVSLARFAGAAIPFQSAMNASLGKSLKSLYFSALTVFVVAFFAMLIYMGMSRQGPSALSQFSHAPK